MSVVWRVVKCKSHSTPKLVHQNNPEKHWLSFDYLPWRHFVWKESLIFLAICIACTAIFNSCGLHQINLEWNLGRHDTRGMMPMQDVSKHLSGVHGAEDNLLWIHGMAAQVSCGRITKILNKKQTEVMGLGEVKIWLSKSRSSQEHVLILICNQWSWVKDVNYGKWLQCDTK